MNFKKFLRRGQASLEYFILFSVIAGLSILSVSTLYPTVKQAIQGSDSEDGFFQIAARRLGFTVIKPYIIPPDDALDPGQPPEPEPPEEPEPPILD